MRNEVTHLANKSKSKEWIEEDVKIKNIGNKYCEHRIELLKLLINLEETKEVRTNETPDMSMSFKMQKDKIFDNESWHYYDGKLSIYLYENIIILDKFGIEGDKFIVLGLNLTGYSTEDIDTHSDQNNNTNLEITNNENSLDNKELEDTNKIDKVGKVVERKLDEYEEKSIFQMTSHYYLCDVCSEQTEKKLDNYEVELDFKAKWIKVDEAIESNEEAINRPDKNPWVYRENKVLKTIEEYLNNNNL